MNAVFALILIGATGSAHRSMVVEQEISGIVARVIFGGVKDVLGRRRLSSAGLLDGSDLRSYPTLTIDNQPRTGWRSWGEAAVRVGTYAADLRHEGSVRYVYRVRVRGYDIRRETVIEDGCVLLVTDAWWVETVPVGRSTRKAPIHVTIRITATELDGRTALVGYASGHADTSDFRCGIIRRFAERQAASTLRIELQKALATIQREGTRMYLGSADIGPILDGIGAGMRTVGPRIGRQR